MSATGARIGTFICVMTCAALAVLLAAPVSHSAGAQAHVAVHYACNEGPKRPCYFSNPAGSVRCVWTPIPNSVTCELLATRRAYRLGATGHARAVKVHLARAGQTLPTNQMVVFPEKLSCQDTKTTMTCNQDEGFGEFKLALHASHSA
jgi:hypothetical protein